MYLRFKVMIKGHDSGVHCLIFTFKATSDSNYFKDTSQKMKFSIKEFFSKCDQNLPTRLCSYKNNTLKVSHS